MFIAYPVEEMNANRKHNDMSNSDQHTISPYNIKALQDSVFMRIEGVITEDDSN